MKLLAFLTMLALPALSAPPASAQRAAVGARAWQRADVYVAPDFEGYFSDDPEGGAELDRLFDANGLHRLAPDELVGVVRRGLRDTTKHRTLILAEVGRRLVWNAEPQDQDAIELCYHASDFRAAAARWGVRHDAVYFGLSVVRPKTPAILRTLAELCVAVDDPNDIGRVAWGAADQLGELLPYLEPFLASDDATVRAKAESVRRILRGELGAFDWAAERARQPARPKPHVELPEVRRVLREGSSAERLDLLGRLGTGGLLDRLDDTYLADFALAAADPDPDVRGGVARTVGNAWVWRAGLHRIAEGATTLLLDLSRDPDEDVRYRAVYYGLSTWHGDDDAVPRRLIELAIEPSDPDRHHRLVWGLEKHGERALRLLAELLRGSDPVRARGAYALWSELSKEPAPFVPAGIAQPDDLVGTWEVALEAPPPRAGRVLRLAVTQAADGALRVAPAPPEPEGDHGAAPEPLLLREVLSTPLGAAVYVDFELRVEGSRLFIGARVEGDQARGTARIDGRDELLVWSAERRARPPSDGH